MLPQYEYDILEGAVRGTDYKVYYFGLDAGQVNVIANVVLVKIDQGHFAQQVSAVELLDRLKTSRQSSPRCSTTIAAAISRDSQKGRQ